MYYRSAKTAELTFLRVFFWGKFVNVLTVCVKNWTALTTVMFVVIAKAVKVRVSNWWSAYQRSFNLDTMCYLFTVTFLAKLHNHVPQSLISYVTEPGAAFEGGKWGDRPRPRSWGGPALQAYEFVKLYSPVNWKCWYMLRLKSFFKVKFRSVVLGCLLYRNRHNQCLR